MREFTKLTHFIILISLFCMSVKAKAENTDAIQSSRPGLGIGSNVAGRGFFQIESGLEHDRTYDSSQTRADIFGNVLRYGFNDQVEMVGLLSARVDYADDGSSAQKGFSELQAGLRYVLNQEASGFVPSLLVQTLFQLNAISPTYRSKDIGNSVTFAATHDLSDAWSLETNLGIEFDGDSTQPAYTFVENLSYDVTPKWSTFVETYGDFQAKKGSPHFDFGGTCLMHNDLQYDLSVGYGKGVEAPEIFIGLGVSWRFQTRSPNAVKKI